MFSNDVRALLFASRYMAKAKDQDFVYPKDFLRVWAVSTELGLAKFSLEKFLKPEPGIEKLIDELGLNISIRLNPSPGIGCELSEACKWVIAKALEISNSLGASKLGNLHIFCALYEIPTDFKGAEEVRVVLEKYFVALGEVKKSLISNVIPE